MSDPRNPAAQGRGGPRADRKRVIIELPPAFQPKTGTMEAWNGAYVRVEDYLRAHRIHNRLHQSRLIQRVLSLAAARHEQNPALDPVTLAIEETDRLMDGWL